MFHLGKLCALGLVAAALAVGSAALHPNRPNWSEEILLKGEVRLGPLLSNLSEILWLDARSQMDFSEGHIPDAILLNEDDWDGLLPDMLSAWQPGQRIVVYCSSQKCHASHGVAERLRTEVGMDQVTVLKGGWEAWQAAHQK